MNTKIAKLILIFFTVCILTLPNICRFFLKITEDAVSENRVLASKPTLSFLNLKDYPRLYDQYYNDNLPFRNDILTLNMKANFSLFGNLDSDRVLLGKDNWLFYKRVDDGDELGNYQGNNHFTQEEMDIILTNINNAEKYFDSLGVELVIYVASNKSVIYDSYMPDNIKVVNSDRRMDVLIDFLKDKTSVPIVYPKKSLIELKDKYQLYYKYDTHWNELGAFVGANELFSALNIPTTSLDQMEINNEGPLVGGDLSNMLAGVSYMFNDDINPQIINFNKNITVRTNDNYASQGRSYISDANDNRYILMLGDSFAEKMEPYIAKTFSKSTFMLFFDGDVNAVIKNEKPDIVVYELLERGYDRLLKDFTRFNIE